MNINLTSKEGDKTMKELFRKLKNAKWRKKHFENSHGHISWIQFLRIEKRRLKHD